MRWDMLKLTKKSWMTSLMICCYLAVIAGCDPVDDKQYLDLTERMQLGAYVSLAVVTSTPEPDGGGGKLEVGDSCPRLWWAWDGGRRHDRK